MTDRPDIAYWLALARAPGIGVAGALALLERYTAPRELFQAAPDLCAGRGLAKNTQDYLCAPPWELIEADLAWRDRSGNDIITWRDSAYPPLLREIADPPLLLFVRGDPALLSRPQLAVVGSRNPSVSGEQTAADFARYLCGAGLGITSGLALGIDAAAHRGALAAGGATIAVAGTGLDRVYPARHRELAHDIAQRGVLVSEFAPGTPALAHHFPRRNRIISGLSLGVLVVEAAPRSGSLITARLAAEQGREVFAIPGSIHNPLARGCHALIRQGAKLVETAEDILEELPVMVGAMANGHEHPAGSQCRTPLLPEQAHVLACIGYEPTAVDSVVERSGLTPDAVSSILLVLELQGHVTPTPGGWYSRQA